MVDSAKRAVEKAAKKIEASMAKAAEKNPILASDSKQAMERKLKEQLKAGGLKPSSTGVSKTVREIQKNLRKGK